MSCMIGEKIDKHRFMLPIFVLAICVLVLMLYSIISGYEGELRSQKEIMDGWEAHLEQAEDSLEVYEDSLHTLLEGESGYPILGDGGLQELHEGLEDVSSWLMQFLSYCESDSEIMDRHNVSEDDIAEANMLLSRCLGLQLNVSVMLKS